MKSQNLQKYLIIAFLISLGISMLVHFPTNFEQIVDDHVSGKDLLNFTMELSITTIVSFLMFVVNYFILKPFQKQEHTKYFAILVSIVLTTVLVIFLSHLLFIIKNFILPIENHANYRSNYSFQNLVVAAAVLICIFIIRLIFQKQTIELENEKLKTEGIQSQYDSLKNQVSPHFLFNSLNALQTLIREDADTAQKYVRHLSQVLRYTLQSNQSKTVMLTDELNFIESYLFLIQLRFGTNFKIAMHIDEEFKNYRIPPLTLQTLIENAVKHNEISKKKPLLIRLETTDNQSVKMSNPIQKKITEEPGTGIGLLNIGKQYHLLAGKQIIIKKVNNEFIVEIPLLNPDFE